MNLLTDRTLEIPAFLLRNPDGTFKHPDCAVALTAAVIPPPDPEEVALTEALAAAQRQDDAVRRALLIRGDTTAKEHKTEQDAARKAQKAATAQRMLQNKLKQRQVFVQHFKWDHEK